jgi:proteasome alpha subunit
VTMPFYSSVDQLLRDRSELARKGIARGRSVVVLTFADGVLFVAENHSPSLRKVSEIYDRIGFAGVGKYSEFEDLRIAGIRLADFRGYSYGREDVTAKSLANAYSQALSGSFTQQLKPYEVEILVGQVGEEPNGNELFHILFDGSVTDEHGCVGIGGRSEELGAKLRETYREAMSLEDAVRTSARALADAEARHAGREPRGRRPGPDPRAAEVPQGARRRARGDPGRRVSRAGSACE